MIIVLSIFVEDLDLGPGVRYSLALLFCLKLLTFTTSALLTTIDLATTNLPHQHPAMVAVCHSLLTSVASQLVHINPGRVGSSF